MTDTFKRFDKDGSGTIDKGEFIKGFTSLGLPVRDDQLEDLWVQLDKDGGGSLNFQELMQGAR